MKDNKLTSIDSNPHPMDILIAQAKEQLPFMEEHLKLLATMTRAKYQALRAEGFSKDVALELCKTLT